MSDVFPQAVIANNLIFLSGTPGLDLSTGKVVSDNFEAQVRQAFLNVKIILKEASSSMSNVIKTTVFMVTPTKRKRLACVFILRRVKRDGLNQWRFNLSMVCPNQQKPNCSTCSAVLDV